MTYTSNDYDVFISYRRQGGATEARLIQAKLAQHGLRVFLDVDELKPGHFDQALLDCIARTPNFVVILSRGSLDHCADERDWLRQEIGQALRTGSKVVPIMMPGFVFPEPRAMPEEIRALRNHQSVSYSHEFFGATLDRLIRYIEHGASPRPAGGARQPAAPQAASAARQPAADRSLTIDASPLFPGGGEVWDEPVYEGESVKTLLDSLWGRLRQHLPPHTYGNAWVLRNRETGEVYWDLTIDLDAYHGLGRVAQTLEEARILPGMTLEILHLTKESP